MSKMSCPFVYVVNILWKLDNTSWIYGLKNQTICLNNMKVRSRYSAQWVQICGYAVHSAFWLRLPNQHILNKIFRALVNLRIPLIELSWSGYECISRTLWRLQLTIITEGFYGVIMRTLWHQCLMTSTALTLSSENFDVIW